MLEQSWGDVVKLAKVDCTAPTSFELCKQAQVSVYPTLCLFRNGQTESNLFYHGDRSAQALMSVFSELMKDWVRGCNWRQTGNCDPGQ